MAYDEGLAQRVRELMEEISGFSEKKMFGGICFLINGNMACGILDYDVIVRVGPENHEASLEKPNTHVFDFTGRPMKGWVVVSQGGHESDKNLFCWVKKGMDYAMSLPEK
ncbi:MAG: TfoX/Sxy family protein [Desulfobacterales bacterium]|nr:TfoX/Sxy family protein [Desulfobacterales bacterium]